MPSCATNKKGATVSLVSNTGIGTASATETFSYDPNSSTACEALTVGQTLTDTTRRSADLQHGDTSTATVTVFVSETDHVTASAASASTNEDSAITITAAASEIGRAHV